MRRKEKRIIGRREIVDFPDLGLKNITAKIDTGAYTAVLHCHDIKVINGILHFKLLDPTHPEYENKDLRFENFYEKEIKNSFGEKEKRFIIKTKVRIARRTINSLISLTDRGEMRYPVLIGRRLIKRKFIVDVSELYLWLKKK